jgi:V8-like Glu-specific endopeptidase
MNNNTKPTKHRRLGVMLGVVMTGMFAYAQEPAPSCLEVAEKPVTVTGKRVSLGELIPSPLNELPVTADSEARYLRVRFSVNAASDCKWYLTVRDGVQHVIQTFSPSTIQNAKNQWTVRVPGSVALFQLERCGENSPSVLVKEYIWMPEQEKNSYYSSQGPVKHFYPLYKATEALVPSLSRPWGDFVGFMMSSWGKRSWTCSGILIAPDLFLTNWHCGGLPQFSSKDGFWSKQIVEDTIIDFSWDDDGLSREYIATECLAADEELDFAVLKIESLETGEEARAAVLSERSAKAEEPISIIHHPAAMRKHFSKCEVVNTDDPTIFTHRCDTEAGSSGAPIFDSHGNVIGLHHHGFAVELKNNRCRDIDNLNKAIRMDKILSYLKEKKQPLYQKLRIVK